MRIDCHMHLSEDPKRWGYTVEEAVKAAEKAGIDRFAASDIFTGLHTTQTQVRRANDVILSAMQDFPDTVLGWCFLHPGYVRGAQDEIERCVVDGGMVGLKLYHQHFIDEPTLFPVIERCIELGVPILMHAGHLTDPESAAGQPRLSGADHFYNAAQRYPEALLIHAHVPGGGDWAWAIKWLRNARSVYADTSGSVIDAGMIERMVRELGPERVLFGTDMQFERGIGKLLSAAITQRQRDVIFGPNFQKILDRRRA